MPTREFWDQYGCRCNAYSPDQVFAAYERLGFLYAAKRRRLAPLWDRIKATWVAAMTQPDLMSVATWGPLNGPRAATGMRLRIGHGYGGQHWAAGESPTGTMALTLAVLAGASTRQRATGFQIWYRPQNRMPARVFGGAARSAGARGAERQQCLLMVPRPLTRTNGIEVARWTPGHRPEVTAFAQSEAGKVWTTVSELDTSDAEWAASDRLWARVGLRYWRRVFVARRQGASCGLAIVHRGPVGLNFSLLENRAELVLARDAPPTVRSATAAALIEAAVAEADPELRDCFPLVCSESDEPVLAELGAKKYRRYACAMWAGQQGTIALLDSVQQRFGRVLQRAERESVT
ncbi:MAG: hypothetical protein AAF628_15805 [Planctomycetota bacterium]